MTTGGQIWGEDCNFVYIFYGVFLIIALTIENCNIFVHYRVAISQSLLSRYFCPQEFATVLKVHL